MIHLTNKCLGFSEKNKQKNKKIPRTLLHQSLDNLQFDFRGHTLSWVFNL